MNSSFFNGFFTVYMFLNYFIQPIFMVVAVILLFKLSRHVSSLDKQNKALVSMLKKTDEVANTSQDNIDVQ